MDNIKFGRDGWRSVIADGFTVGNLARMARALSRWLVNQQRNNNPSVIIGFDTRFGGEMFAETVAKVFALAGIKVYLSDRFVSAPMVSYGIVCKKASMGVMITASHSPYHYNGIKIKGFHGGPLLDADIKNIENMVPELNEIHLESLHFNEYVEKEVIKYINLEEIYLQNIRNEFDVDAIEKSGLVFAFDAMYGAGQQVIKKLLSGVHLLHCEHDFTFRGITPDPQFRNLKELSAFVKETGNIDCSLAVDGDADRVALLDKDGNYINSHLIMLLLIQYLYKYRGFEGKVVAGFYSTRKIEKLCNHYGLEVQRVREGFKEISSIMLREKVLVAGEESGGIAVNSCIPDSDGIWAGLLVWQFMVESGKSLKELIDEVYKITGSFAFERLDLELDKNRKKNIIEKCRNGHFRKFGNRVVERVEILDGYKYYFNADEWLLIRPSGTDPFLCLYAESFTPESAGELLKDARETILLAAPGNNMPQ